MLKGLVLPDPNSPGKDLYTTDGTVVIQARILTRTSALNTSRLENVLDGQISRLINKLRQDFDYNPNAKVGYAILSYLDAAIIRSRIVKVKR
jgi:hypothetical protein